MQTKPCIAAILATAVSGVAGILSGTVLNPDSTARSGVVVKLASSGEVATTGVDGSWSLPTSATDGIRARPSAARPVDGHLAVQNGRIRVSLDGRDLVGRLNPATAAASLPLAAPRSLDAAPDTLIYSWNGKTILRDTVSALSQRGLLRTFDTTVNAKITYGYVTDSRDGRVYRTVKIGDKFWTAQNANFAVDSSWCFEKLAANCAVYGRLYKWHAALGLTPFYDANEWAGDSTSQQGACPAGWRVPNFADWKAMLSVPTETRGGTLLKSTDLWTINPGTDSLGFKVLPGGYLSSSTGTFLQQGGLADFWTTSESGESSGRFFHFSKTYVTASSDTRDKKSGHSLRCIKKN